MTPRLAAAPLALVALFTPGDDDEPVTLSELDLDVSALAEAREQVFEYRVGSTSYGTVTFATEGTDDGAIRFHDVHALEFDGESLAADLTLVCEPTPALRSRTIHCVASGTSDEAKTYDAELDGDELVVRIEGRDPRTHTFDEDATTYESLFRLVTLLPFEEGLQVALPNRFEGVEANMHAGRREALTYAGTEWYAADGTNLEMLHRFDLVGPFGRGISYWVNADRELRRVMMDGRKELRPVRPKGDK